MASKINQQVKTLKSMNKWKAAFFVLLALVLGLSLLLVTRLYQEREAIPPMKIETSAKAGIPVLNVRSNKEQINALVAFYLEDLQKETEQNYQFVLKNEALLTGEFDLLGFPVTFYLYFDPYVMEDGNVQLKAKSLSIGALGLPINQVLRMIKNNSQIPEWIEVQPKEERIVLRLDQFQLKNGLSFRADKLNLVEDEIQLSVYLPENKVKEKE
ncbi:YpmS family protein [Enterococcus sp. LJL98]